MYKTKVKATAVSNLTDARFFAAKCVDWVGFNMNTASDDYLSTADMQTMKDWIEGVDIVAEFGDQDHFQILSTLNKVNPHLVQVNSNNEYDEDNIPKIIEIVIDQDATEAVLTAPETTENISFFLVDIHAVGWHNLGTIKDKLVAFCQAHKVVLHDNWEVDTLQASLELPLYGISIKGGTEEKVGYKSFDELEDLFEVLEDNE